MLARVTSSFRQWFSAPIRPYAMNGVMLVFKGGDEGYIEAYANGEKLGRVEGSYANILSSGDDGGVGRAVGSTRLDATTTIQDTGRLWGRVFEIIEYNAADPELLYGYLMRKAGPEFTDDFDVRPLGPAGPVPMALVPTPTDPPTMVVSPFSPGIGIGGDRLVPVNDDWDILETSSSALVCDKVWNGSIPMENDLVALTISVSDEDLEDSPDWHLDVWCPIGSGRARAWEESTGGHCGADSDVILLPPNEAGAWTWTGQQIAALQDGWWESNACYYKVFYIEGRAVSDSIDDVKLRIHTYEVPEEGSPVSWTIDYETLTVHQCEFIDDIPDYAAVDTNDDSDNFFLREVKVTATAGDPDYKDLDIYYRILPAGLPVDDVQIDIYKGNTASLVCTTNGSIDASGQYETGDKLLVNWTPTLFSADSDPGFYRLQLRVYAVGGSEPLLETPIRDADPAMTGWQCPQKGLAVHDLVWKHRPLVYLSAGEDVGPPQHPFNTYMKPWMRHKNGVAKTDPTLEYSLISPPPDYNNFGSLASVDHELLLQRSQATQQPYLDIHDSRLQARTAPGVLFVHSPRDLTSAVLLKHPNHVFIQCWMYQPSSHGVFNNSSSGSNELAHEGDWEMCQFTIRLNKSSDPAVKKYWLEPFAATASQHYYGQTLLWDRDHDGPGPINQDYVYHNVDGNRVKLFIAENAHAT